MATLISDYPKKDLWLLVANTLDPKPTNTFYIHTGLDCYSIYYYNKPRFKFKNLPVNVSIPYSIFVSDESSETRQTKDSLGLFNIVHVE